MAQLRFPPQRVEIFSASCDLEAQCGPAACVSGIHIEMSENYIVIPRRFEYESKPGEYVLGIVIYTLLLPCGRSWLLQR